MSAIFHLRRSTRIVIGLLLAVAGIFVGALSVGGFDSFLVKPVTRLGDPETYTPVEIDLQASQNVQVIPTDWPMLFGPQRNSMLPEDRTFSFRWEGEQGPAIAWRKQLGDGYSSPVISQGKVIVLFRRGDEEFLQCLNLEDGETIWELVYPTAYVCPHPPHSSGPYSTPLIDGDRVYAQSAEGVLNCLKLDDGELIWSRSLSKEYEVPENVFAVGHSPALDREQLIINIGASQKEAGIIAINKMTGDTNWQAGAFGASYATPVLATMHEQPFCFVLTAEAAVCLNPETGIIDWSFPLKAKAEDFVNATSPVVAGDVVLFTAYQGGTIYSRIQQDRSRTEIRHDRRTLVSQFNPLTAHQGYIFGWHFLDQSFRCIDLQTGELQWNWVSGIGRGTHVINGDEILLFGETGKIAIVAFRPDQLEILQEPSASLLAEPAFSAPAVAGQRVLLKNEREIVCLDFAR